MIISSRVPSGFTTDMSTNSSMVGVSLNVVILRRAHVSSDMIFIGAPKSTKVFGKLSP